MISLALCVQCSVRTHSENGISCLLNNNIIISTESDLSRYNHISFDGLIKFYLAFPFRHTRTHIDTHTLTLTVLAFVAL